MSFSTVCSNCDARLTAPDTVEGKRVKCKKCGEAFLAKRAAEDDDEDERPAKPIKSTVKMPAVTPKSKPARDDDDLPRKSAKGARRHEDDDGDDEDEEEPKPKAKKKGKGKGKKQAGSPVLLFVLIGVGALLVLGGGGVGAYYAFIKEDTKPDNQAKGGPPPSPPPGPGGPAGPAPGASTAGWVEIHEAEGKYRVKFPTQPQERTIQQQTPMGPVPIKAHVGGGQNEAFISAHQVIPDRGGLTDDQLFDLFVEGVKAQAKGATVSNSRPITYQNLQGRELTLTLPGKKGALISRLILASDRVLVLTAGGDNATAESPRVKAFFESLKIQ